VCYDKYGFLSVEIYCAPDWDNVTFRGAKYKKQVYLSLALISSKLVRFQALAATSMQMIVFWAVPPCILVVALMMEAVSTSESSVRF
jgi:hypothetical protein